MSDRQSRSWSPILEPDHLSTALAITLEVASRLRKEKYVTYGARLAEQQTVATPWETHWQPSSVAHGYAGLALMSSYLDACFPDERWDLIGHQYLTLAGREVEKHAQLPLGLFGGLSGLAFAAWSLSRKGTRYQRLLTTIEDLLFPRAQAQAHFLATQPSGLPVATFDMISGLSGIGLYLSCRQHLPAAAETLQVVLQALVTLCLEEEAGLPRWYTPAAHMSDARMRAQFPAGNLNCGLAHGIPGPLGLLALAADFPLEVVGLDEAITHIADWLIGYHQDDTWGINWPVAVPVEEPGILGTAQPSLSPAPRQATSRAAWCYGSPGIAWALWLAGKAAHQTDYCKLAIAAMEAVYRRPAAERRIDAPTFCHGVAGLLQITLHFARETGLPLFTEAATNLCLQLFDLYDPHSLFGYRNSEGPGIFIDSPGLLEGAAGSLLALLAAATEVPPLWARLFLLL